MAKGSTIDLAFNPTNPAGQGRAERRSESASQSVLWFVIAATTSQAGRGTLRISRRKRSGDPQGYTAELRKGRLLLLLLATNTATSWIRRPAPLRAPPSLHSWLSAGSCFPLQSSVERRACTSEVDPHSLIHRATSHSLYIHTPGPEASQCLSRTEIFSTVADNVLRRVVRLPLSPSAGQIVLFCVRIARVSAWPTCQNTFPRHGAAKRPRERLLRGGRGAVRGRAQRPPPTTASGQRWPAQRLGQFPYPLGGMPLDPLGIGRECNVSCIAPHLDFSCDGFFRPVILFCPRWWQNETLMMDAAGFWIH